MSLREIVLEETQPETEWVRERALQKVSPTYRHGLAQSLIATALRSWAYAGRHGRVATEWRFRVTPPGEVTRPLVPDVAYISYIALPADAPIEAVEVPRAAPTVAFEVLSPDDRAEDVQHKVEVYLTSGSSAVITVDPVRERAVIYDSAGEQTLLPSDVLAHPALPGFTFDLSSLFAHIRSLR